MDTGTKRKKKKTKTTVAVAPEKRERGRPTKYDPEYAEQARKLCLLGATDPQLADFFGVVLSTISLWKVEHKDFSDALKAGKMAADAQVAEKLFSRALGYSHPEDKLFQNDGQVIVQRTTKHYPPDPTAAIFWLKNRQPELWREKPEPKDDEADRVESITVNTKDARVDAR